jgi:hypothetical protein
VQYRRQSFLFLFLHNIKNIILPSSLFFLEAMHTAAAKTASEPVHEHRDMRVKS